MKGIDIMLKYVHNPRNAMFLTMDPCGWSNDKIAHVECLTKKCQDIGQTAAHTISANVASELIKQDIPEFYDTHQGMALNLSDFLNKCELVAIDELMVQLAERKKVILNAISENNFGIVKIKKALKTLEKEYFNKLTYKPVYIID